VLKGVLPKDYARPGLDKERLGQLVNLVSDIALGDPVERAGFARAAPGGARSAGP
jgi:type I restriction enzyme M protein